MLALIRTTHLRDIIETHQRLAADFSEMRSTILRRLQRVERELLSAKLDRFFAQLHLAIELTIERGLEAAASIEKSSHAMVAPFPRGKAGGLARSRDAWRYSDGTFMPESKKWEAYQEIYERDAAGGRARAAKALRAADGTFLAASA